ncbi:MAG: chromate transporter [Xenococcaceae cyanobacterium]
MLAHLNFYITDTSLFSQPPPESLQEIIVHDLNWLTQQEFTYGLAVGQVTPGPIVISAAFIGYKVAKIYGALAATIGIFLPPFLLTIAGASILERIKQSPQIQAAMNGIRPAVIGMIFAAFWIVGQTASPTWVSGLIFVVRHKSKGLRSEIE